MTTGTKTTTPSSHCGKMGIGIFSDCVFFLKVNTLPLKEKTNLKTCITTNGGAISFVVNEKCTHVIVASNAALNSSQQKNIQKHGIPIVKPDFIWKSINENQLADVELTDSRALEVKLEQVKEDKKSQFLAKFMKYNTTETAESDFIDDEEFDEQGDLKDLPHDTEVAKYSFFQKGQEIAVLEILCFSEQGHFPFKVSTTCGIPGTTQKEFTFSQVDSSEKACNKYEQHIKDLENKGFVQINKIEPEAEFLASQALQKVLLGDALNVTQLLPEVGEFVESIWIEAQGHLTYTLSCPVENTSLNDVSKAEGILQNMRNALNKGEDTKDLIQEFYQCIPHRRKNRFIDKKFVTEKQDLCQLIRDMVNISETNSTSTVGKYRALKCRVEYVDPNTEEFNRVQQEVLNNNHSNEEFHILHVLRVGRLTEATNFKSDLGNVKSLLHASSPRNIVGILSRGLLLPKMVVDEFGVERTDIGNLGSGIYFSDSISTSVKYTEAFKVSRERVLLVCDVALGKTKDVGQRDYSITEPPEGFHSLHGVRSDVWKNSQFIDDEYVVYNVNQVKMSYVVRLCTSEDTLNPRRKPKMTLLEETEQMVTCEPTEDDPVEDLPEANVVKGGLQGMDGKQIPLESIHVKARLKDLAAQVVIFQTYKNNSVFPIEAKFVFPLDSTAAVCGFEAFINGKHIVGEVKEKQQAHREYRTAISQGHGAYLMDQDSPDVFTVSVGNLPSKATVIIKITYVAELQCCNSEVYFSIPGTVASWQEDQALKENTQDTVAKVGIESDKAVQGNFCLDMSVEMPRKIESIWSFSHSIQKKQTECKAVIQVEKGSSLTDAGFSLNIQLEDAYIPRMWVETHPDQDSEACMLIFQPQFESSYEDPKLTICLDCSNSMESCFQSAKRVALLALSSLYPTAINVITFGSTYKEFHLYPKGTDKMPEMEKFIKMAKPNMGSTEFWKPLQSIGLLKPSSGYHKILLISDGHLQNDNLVFQILKKNANHIKLFTCGVGAKANKHMLRCLARDGAGAFEFFADKAKSSWKSQMEKHYSRLRSAACTAVSVKWRLFGRNPAEPMQAPANIPSLYENDSLFVYGLVPHCTQATLKALINNKEFENMVSTTSLQKTSGTVLHKLTARAFIRDYEDGVLHEKEHENEMEKQKMKSFIIKLSKEHSIVTQFTSFVAVEKRSADETENVEPNSLAIISAEDVDILPYMDYSDDVVLEAQSDSDKQFEAQPDSDKEEYIISDFLNEADSLEVLEAQSDSEKDLEDFSEKVRFGFSFEDEGAFLKNSRSQSGGLFGQANDQQAPPRATYELFEQSKSMDTPTMLSRAYGPQSTLGFGSALGSGFHTLAESGHKEPQPLLGSPLAVSWGSGSIQFSSRGRAGNFGSYTDTPTMLSRADGPQSTLGFGSALGSGFHTLAESGHKETQPLLGSPIAVSWGSGSVQFSSRGRAGNFGSYTDPPTMLSRADGPQSTLGFGSALGSGFLTSAESGHKEPQPLLGSPLATDVSWGSGSFPFSSRGRAQKFESYTARNTSNVGIERRPLIPANPWSSMEIEPMVEAAGIPPPPLPPRQSIHPTFTPAVRTLSEDSGLHRTMEMQMPRRARERTMAPAEIPPPPSPPFLASRPLFLRSSAYDEPASDRAKGDGIRSRQARYTRNLEIEQWPLNLGKSWSMEIEPMVGAAGIPPPPPPPAPASQSIQPTIVSAEIKLPIKKKKFFGFGVPKQTSSQIFDLSWSSLSPLQSQEGYWMLTPQLGMLLKIDIEYICDHFLVKKGISSLGLRGKEEVLKLIATLLVLQTIRNYNLVSGITFKTLMKLDQCDTESQSYPEIEKAVNWAVRTDRQYSGVCSRLGLGRDWEQATRQLLGLELASSDLSLALRH